MRPLNNSHGVSLIAAIFIIVILAFMGVMFVSLIGTSSLTSVNDLQSAQALYVAEGGAEFIVENQPFPNYSLTAATTLGSGSFTVATPTYLTVDPGVAGTTITVNSTATFPAAGRIVIDSELINYTGTTATTFTGATRAVSGTTATTHAVNNAVYPVAILTADPGAGGATLNVQANTTTGFLIPGIFKVDEEYIYCTGSTATTFTNCTRGYKGSTADAHPVGRNVFQYPITSAGSVANARRQVERALVGTGNSFYKGSFAKNGVVGNQVIAGVGFRPTAVIFFWTRQTATGFLANESTGFGFASDAAQRSVAIEGDDNVNRSTYSRVRSETSVILMLRPNGRLNVATLSAMANLVSLDDDGFTINWGTNEARSDIIHYIALGRDVAAASVGTFSLPQGGAAVNQAVAGVGFRPDFVMLLNSSIDTAEALNTPQQAKLFNLGFMTPANQGTTSVCGRWNRNATTHAYSWQQTTRSIMGMDYTGACTAEFEASFVSMDADGFTIFRNRSPLTVGAAPIFYLALKGGQHDVGFFTQPTATITGIGFQPQGLFMTSFNRVASVAIAAQGEISIGAAQSIANQGTIWAESRAALNTDANMITYTDSAYVAATGPSPGTTNARANFVQFNSDSFTLNWTTNDGTARQILYWTVGPNVARSGPQPQIQPVNLDWREVYP